MRAVSVLCIMRELLRLARVDRRRGWNEYPRDQHIEIELRVRGRNASTVDAGKKLEIFRGEQRLDTIRISRDFIALFLLCTPPIAMLIFEENRKKGQKSKAKK